VQNLMLTEFKINNYDVIKDPLNVFEPEREQQSNANSEIGNASTNRDRYCSSAFSENKNELSSNCKNLCEIADAIIALSKFPLQNPYL
ncbi:hypothetical protein THOM_0128, partial [Trachipleistophora hominis]